MGMGSFLAGVTPVCGGHAGASLLPALTHYGRQNTAPAKTSLSVMHVLVDCQIGARGSLWWLQLWARLCPPGRHYTALAGDWDWASFLERA